MSPWWFVAMNIVTALLMWDMGSRQPERSWTQGICLGGVFAALFFAAYWTGRAL